MPVLPTITLLCQSLSGPVELSLGGSAYRHMACIIIRREALADSRPFIDLRFGVYVLVCGDRGLYVGQSDNVYNRLRNHSRGDSPRADWRVALVFCDRAQTDASDTLFPQPILNWLERSLCVWVRENGYTLLAQAAPVDFRAQQADEALLAHITSCLDVVRVILPHTISPPETHPDEPSGVATFRFAGAGFDATMEIDLSETPHRERNGRLSRFCVILPGSTVNQSPPAHTSGNQQAGMRQRERLISNGYIVDGVFQMPARISNPSQAAALVSGRSQNGLDVWISCDGSNRPLSEFFEE